VPLWFGSTVSSVSIIAVPVMLGLMLLLLLHTPTPMRTASLVAALSAGFVLPATLGVAPNLDYLWPSQSAAAMLARHPPRPGEAVLSVGYSEPSLVFLLGTATRLVTAEPADDQLTGAGLALVNDRYAAEFLRSLARHGLTGRALDRAEGLDYSAGSGKLVLSLYRLERG
jgi:hypothetical protein